MYGIAPSRDRDLEDLVATKVGIAGCRWPDRPRRIADANMQRLAVGLGVHRDCLDTSLVAATRNADRDLAPVGDEDTLEGMEIHSPRLTRAVSS